MTPEDRRRGEPREKDQTKEYALDELARGLATGSISRRRALRLLVGTLLGGLLASSPGIAWAQETLARSDGGAEAVAGGTTAVAQEEGGEGTDILLDECLSTCFDATEGCLAGCGSFDILGTGGFGFGFSPEGVPETISEGIAEDETFELERPVTSCEAECVTELQACSASCEETFGGA